MNSPTQQAGVLTEIVVTIDQTGKVVSKARGIIDRVFLVGVLELAKLQAAGVAAVPKDVSPIQVPTPDLARQLVP